MKSPKPTQTSLLSQCRSYNELHMLYSMLPKQFSQYPKEQFKKTKDFYKPEQFIWNNPHRTSDRMYQYYHKGLEEYKRVKEPRIVEQEERERECKEISRIRHLSIKRQEARFRFHSKQMERLSLQNKSGIIRDSSTQLITQLQNLSTKNHDTPHDHSTNTILRRSNSQSIRIPTNKSMKINFLQKNLKKSKQQEASINEKSYLQSVENFDSKNQLLMRTIKKSQIQMKDQIRQNFLKQKENNHLVNSTIQSFAQTKPLKSTFKKKKTLKFDLSNLSRKSINMQNLQHQRS